MLSKGSKMKIKIFNIEGKTTGEEIELDPSVFEIEPNDHALAMAVTAELTNRRQGTRAVKNRTQVRGGGRKPWRQKGRGAARAGTIRSPIWRGGGVIFGPKPQNYRMRINKKVNRLARRSALTYKIKEDAVKILNDFNWEDGKTRNARNMMKAFKIEKVSILLLTAEYSKSIYQACKNIAGFEVNKAIDASARQILKTNILLIQKSALPALKEVLG